MDVYCSLTLSQNETTAMTISCVSNERRQPNREGEGQRVRNRIVQKMKHREELKKQALARGESIEDWDKIALVGKKMKGSAATATTTMPTTTAATAESSAINIVGAS